MPRSSVARAACLLCLLAALACSDQTRGPVTLDQAGLRAGFDSAADRLLSALRSDAPDSLMALMGEDVQLMPPGEAVLEGRTAVRAWYDLFVSEWRTSSLTVTDREVLLGADWATEFAGFEWTLVPAGGGPAVVDRGNYAQLWRRDSDGRWLLTRELWNGTAPP